ncbi:diphthine--ammonia ligase [Lentibacillus cibarius]|uniref:Diphthine--ammonia ligase n=1 Tax=Lentibacillus cibarius TaxID=2583219 RepID=A0A549YIH0_9BACI|nr:diphthine--ammonia ligase [Lentibacillus cibarius]TRM11675.1 diphthine--ammonia ligase [Lentibacillus cibarius]
MPTQVALSFSGGKDSCLALYYLQQEGIAVKCLLTTAWKHPQTTVAHEEEHSRIHEQAERLGIPVHFIETDFSTYADDFVFHIGEMKRLYGIDGIAFGDIYLDGHREWGETIAERAGVEAVYPLWADASEVAALLRKFVSLGFRAEVIKVDSEKLPQSWVGRELDEAFINDIITYSDVCPMGESGEYHTYVYDGPIFEKGRVD